MEGNVPTPPRVAVGRKLPETLPEVSPWELPADLYERWEERVCIMHYDGRLPWREAEALFSDIGTSVPLLHYKGEAALQPRVKNMLTSSFGVSLNYIWVDIQK